MISNKEKSQNRMELLMSHKELLKLEKNSAAKILSQLSPDLFATTESARSFLRYITKNSGGAAAARAESSGNFIPDSFGLLKEESDNLIEEPFIIPTGIDNMGIIGDLHSLFFDRDATYAALEYLMKEKVDALYINGDLIDFYQESKYLKEPNKLHFTDERKWGIDFLKMVQDMFNIVYYKKGNHENRFEHYMLRNAPAVYGDEYFTLESVLGFDGSHINFIQDLQKTKFGKLHILHGHEIPGGGAQNIARNRMLRTYSNIAFNHHHTSDVSFIRDLDGKHSGAFAIGCLCKLMAGYSFINQWMHGFATVKRVGSDGNFTLSNKRIMDGLIY